MSFFRAKREHICHECRTSIQRGEDCYRFDKLGIIFHISCFMRWQSNKLIQAYGRWKEDRMPRPKLGRPLIVCKDRTERRRLLSLRTYYVKKDNKNRVDEINMRIGELENV